nr:MAG TPA: hypothetical protein [Caudoviricetes sp.]
MLFLYYNRTVISFLLVSDTINLHFLRHLSQQYHKTLIPHSLPIPASPVNTILMGNHTRIL